MWGEVLRSAATVNACFDRTAQPRNQSERLIPPIGQVASRDSFVDVRWHWSLKWNAYTNALD